MARATWRAFVSSFVVHLVRQPLPGARVAVLGRVGRHLWLVVDPAKPDAGEHAAILLRQEGAGLLERETAGALAPAGRLVAG